jgi:5-oxoprolinase (ATP-hydrolysing) subunit A
VRAECVCVHSDTPGAVDVAKAVRAAISGYVH